MSKNQIRVYKNNLVMKNNSQINRERIDEYKKIRKVWTINPYTKIKPNKKKEKISKKELKNILKQEDL